MAAVGIKSVEDETILLVGIIHHILDKLGYKAKKVQPVDMFPNTSHVESIALIVRSDT